MGTPFLIWLGLSVLMFVLALFRPDRFRCFAGIFFLVMALGVNLPMLINAPELFEQLGADSLLPFYRDLFHLWVAPYTAWFVVPIIVFEVTVGALMLGRGQGARYGVIGAACFLVATAPLHPVTLANIVAATAFLHLLRTPFDRSLGDMVRRLLRRWRSLRSTTNHA